MHKLPRFNEPHAMDVAAASAAYLVERINDGLAELDGTEMHGEITTVLLTTLRSYFEFLPSKPVPKPSFN